jgi:beta-fructofuranosidase
MLQSNEELKKLLNDSPDNMKKAMKLADNDPSRPRYHFHSPGNWMDDPNGIIYYKGYFHIMYSQNPWSWKDRAAQKYRTTCRVFDPNHEDWTGGITVWGHARSKDMIHWEHLPWPILPAIDDGEHFIYFGCTAINGRGKPIAIYTSVGPNRRPEINAPHHGTIGDDDLIRWKKCTENPVITLDNPRHNGGKTITEWRDPFIFKENGHVYLLMGCKLLPQDGGDAAVILYEACNEEYTEWKYNGILFRHPIKDIPSIECPDVIRFGDKWLFLISTHGQLEYFVGILNLEKCTFEILNNGLVDHGTKNVYASNVLKDDRSRDIMWAAIEGFQNNDGWNGCLTLPRVIGITDDNRIIQKPPIELESLRKDHIVNNFSGKGGVNKKLGVTKSGTFEILTEVKGKDFLIDLQYGQYEFKFVFRNNMIQYHEKLTPLNIKSDRNIFHIFIDQSLVEVFCNYSDCVTQIIPTCEGECSVSICSDDENAEYNINVWDYRVDCLFDSMPFVKSMENFHELYEHQ